jgi:transcriptional regulator with XRE-family HTH domain
MAGKKPNQTDVAVGQRIRAFRKEANRSQTELANQIGVTFQQVQKYENGTNRVGAGRLTLIARALDVPINAFFDGLTRRTDKRRDDSARLAGLESLPAARKLLKAFSDISDAVIQVEIIKLVRALHDG